MKTILIRLLYSLILISLPLFSDIDDQIEAIENASESERFAMMNSFKKELIQLQEEERIDAMKKLISITESNNSKEVMEELTENSRVEEYIGDELKDDIEENIEFESEEDGDNEYD